VACLVIRFSPETLSSPKTEFPPWFIFFITDFNTRLLTSLAQVQILEIGQGGYHIVGIIRLGYPYFVGFKKYASTSINSIVLGLRFLK